MALITRTAIGVGTSPNDGTGDPLRTAMQTVNTTFEGLFEHYRLLGGSQLITTGAKSIATNTRTQLTFDSSTDWGGLTVASGNTFVIPSAWSFALVTLAVQYNLTSATGTYYAEITTTASPTIGNPDTFQRKVDYNGGATAVEKQLTVSWPLTCSSQTISFYVFDNTGGTFNAYGVAQILGFGRLETP